MRSLCMAWIDRLIAAAETHRVAHVAARRLPYVAQPQPAARDLALPAVACDHLREDAVVVTDPVADCRVLKRGERVEKARREPAEASVAEPRIDFLPGDVLELVAHRLEGGARLVHQIALEAVQGIQQGSARQIF